MKILDKYPISYEGTQIKVLIYQKESSMVPIYEIGVLDVSPYTQYIITKIKEDLLREGVFDQKDEAAGVSFEQLKKKYIVKIRDLIGYYFPNIGLEMRDQLVTYIIQKSLDLGFVDLLVADSGLEEITVNGAEAKIMVYHRKHGWLETNLKFFNDEEIKNISSRIALENKKYFSNLHPLLDAHLRGGHRVNATLEGISTKGSSITLRRFSDKPWTVADLINSGTSSEVVLAMIWIAIENEMSILVAGGTGSGKTSFLNAISSFIPANQRIISVEDTREIRLPDYAHWVPMEARQPNQEGQGGVSILDLIVNSLRMRPDRIMIGEIRKSTEAEVLFEAMRTGHSVYGTFHANTVDETVLRLSSAPISIPKITLGALDMIAVQHRDRRSGKRFTLQLAELTPMGDGRVIFQYQPKTGKYVMKNKPVALIRKLEELYGMDQAEFMRELQDRAMLLKFLATAKINQIDKVGKIINRYYNDKKRVMQGIKQRLAQQARSKK